MPNAEAALALGVCPKGVLFHKIHRSYEQRATDICVLSRLTEPVQVGVLDEKSETLKSW
jgi:hypothetical protein